MNGGGPADAVTVAVPSQRPLQDTWVVSIVSVVIAMLLTGTQKVSTQLFPSVISTQYNPAHTLNSVSFAENGAMVSIQLKE